MSKNWGWNWTGPSKDQLCMLRQSLAKYLEQNEEIQ